MALPPFLPDNDLTRRQMAMFHGAIRFMDHHVGRLLGALDASGLRDNTIVIFTTDHGMAFPRAKSTLYDPGIGTACIVRMPEPTGLRGKTHEHLISSVDLRPTLCELGRARTGEEVDGRSFAALLAGGGEYRPRSDLFSEKNYHNHFDPCRCVRTDRYKYIRNFRDQIYGLMPSDIEMAFPARWRRRDLDAPRPPEELYDLAADPWEARSLIDDDAHAAARDELRRKLQEWMEQTHDPILKGRFIPYPPEQFAARGR